MAAAGVPLKADRDQAWVDFCGWRVNYDEPLLGLCALVEPPPAPWSSDRVGADATACVATVVAAAPLRRSVVRPDLIRPADRSGSPDRGMRPSPTCAIIVR